MYNKISHCNNTFPVLLNVLMYKYDCKISIATQTDSMLSNLVRLPYTEVAFL